MHITVFRAIKLRLGILPVLQMFVNNNFTANVSFRNSEIAYLNTQNTHIITNNKTYRKAGGK